MELNFGKLYEGEARGRGRVFGLIFNACPRSSVVSDFLLLRSSKQAGAFVVNLQNLPEAERIAPKWSCLCVVEDGASFLGHRMSSVPPILWNGPPPRSYF